MKTTKLIILFILSFSLFSCSINQKKVKTIKIPTANIDTTKEVLDFSLKPNPPMFTNISIDFKHSFDSKKSLAFLGATFIDIDNDGQNEFLITGGAGQKDGVFKYKNNQIVNITEQTGINNTLPSYGAYSIDYDEDGDDDLFITRQDGVYYYKNTNGVFDEKKLKINLPKKSVPIDIDFSDIDSDGDIDLYISTFINQKDLRSAVFNDPNHVQKNILLKNNGDLIFEDITEKSGLNVISNTFTSTFADLDNDNDPDIILSSNTDTIKIFENKNGKFNQVYDSGLYGFWMGLAVADIDNDNDLDLFFSNVGTSIPERFLGGDTTNKQKVTPKYLLLENNGNLNFTKKEDEAVNNLGFGWGIVPVNFNLDKNQDFLIAQNYIKWIPHKLSKLPGSLLVKNKGAFQEKIEDLGLENENYGISALVGDINNDNLNDIIYINLNGEPNIYIHNIDQTNQYIKVKIPNTKKYLNARFILEFEGKKTITKQYIPKQGLMTKQDNSIIFGLNGEKIAPNSLKIIYQNGEEENIKLNGGKIIKL